MKKVTFPALLAALASGALITLSCSITTNNVILSGDGELDLRPRIESFSVGVTGERVVINDRDRTVTVAVPVGTPSIQTPVIQISGDILTPPSGVEQDFSGSVTYRVAKNTGEDRVYSVSMVTYTAESPGSLEVEASRTGGVGPLSVVFTASLPDVGGESPWFFDYEFSWNFGDPESGVWSTTGRSRNTAKGPVAGHVFERPGTYQVSVSVSDGESVIDTETVTVTVEDPASVYGGTDTICVSTTLSFNGAPAGALRITTDDLSTVMQYMGSGKRLLLRRGDSWSVSNLGEQWPAVDGPVTVGAFGTGAAPVITVTGGIFLQLDNKRDWRIMDLSLEDPTNSFGIFSGSMGMQRILFLRIKTRGFGDGIGWAHWNDSRLLPTDQMSIVDCDIRDARVNVGYVGAERLMILGNTFANADESHVLRVWQAYQGVIGENRISGSSVASDSGRQALKLHGPMESEIGPEVGTGNMAHRTSYVVISGNLFGSSGPWPISMAPQNSFSDERLSYVLFERNRYCAEYGVPNSTPTQIGLRIQARNSVIRNNIIDSGGAANDFVGILVAYDNAVPGEGAPPSENVAVYNNTIYKGEWREETWVGVKVESGVVSSVVKNNLVCFPSVANPEVLDDKGLSRSSAANLLVDSDAFTDLDELDPLDRDFRLTAGAEGVEDGVVVPVFDDFFGDPRPAGSAVDVGAIEGVF